jgi:hypothetical protein
MTDEGRRRLVNGVNVYAGPVMNDALDRVEQSLDYCIATAEERGLNETASALQRLRDRLTDLP